MTAIRNILLIAISLGASGTAGAAGFASADDARMPPTQAENETADFARIGDHFKRRLSNELFANFALFIYVDKAVRGPYAQRMFMFQKTENGELDPLYDWPVSTGRETIETDLRGRLESSRTPMGYYELDPRRFYTEYRSYEWNEPMPYAMFFSWRAHGQDTGLAIHGVEGAMADSPGRRTSEGCIHLSVDHAESLHGLVELKYAEQVPVLVYRNEVSDISSDGLLQRDSAGHFQYRKGYSVLVLVDDFGEEAQIGSTMPLLDPPT